MSDSGVKGLGAPKTFTDQSEALDPQFEKTGGKGAIRQGGNEHYVKDNSKTYDLHIALPGKLQERLDKFNNAAQSLSDGINLEYGGLKVGDKEMSDYAMGHVMDSDGVHRIDNPTYTDIKNRIQIGLIEAANTAESTGDYETLALLHDRERILAATERADDSQGVPKPGAWRQRVEGFHLLRNATAEYLKGTEEFRPPDNLSGDALHKYNGKLLVQADKMIRDSGALHLGLTDRSIEKVSDYLRNNVNFTSDFSPVVALGDKVGRADDVTVNMDRAFELHGDIENKFHELEQSSTHFETDSNRILNVLAQGKGLLNLLNASVVQGKIYNDADTASLSVMFSTHVENVSEILKRETNASQDDTGLMLPGGAPQDRFLDALRDYKNAAAFIADDLSTETDVVGGAQGRGADEVIARSGPAQNFDAVDFGLLDNDPLQQKSALRVFDEDNPIGQNLDEPQSLYAKDQNQSSGALSKIKQAIQDHNINLASVKEVFTAYLAKPAMENLANLRDTLRSALDSSNQLLTQLKSLAREKLGANNETVANDIALLNAQTTELQNLAAAADLTMESVRSEASVEENELSVSDMPTLPREEENLLDIPLDNQARNPQQAGNAEKSSVEYDDFLDIPSGAAASSISGQRAGDDSEIDDFFLDPRQYASKVAQRNEAAQANFKDMAEALDAFTALSSNFNERMDKLVDAYKDEAPGKLQTLLEMGVAHTQLVDAMTVNYNENPPTALHTAQEVYREFTALNAELEKLDLPAQQAQGQSNEVDISSEIESDDEFADDLKNEFRDVGAFSRNTPSGPANEDSPAIGTMTPDGGVEEEDDFEDMYGPVPETPGQDDNVLEEADQSKEDLARHIEMQRRHSGPSRLA